MTFIVNPKYMTFIVNVPFSQPEFSVTKSPLYRSTYCMISEPSRFNYLMCSDLNLKEWFELEGVISLWNLEKQSRRHRHKTNNHPRNPTTNKFRGSYNSSSLSCPWFPDDNPHSNGELLPLWDSGYDITTLLFCSKPDNSWKSRALYHWWYL